MQPATDVTAEAVSFLSAGYRSGVEWWEVIVLLRKMAIFVVAALCPLSWSTRSYIIYLLLVLVGAELLHIRVKPYVDPMLNGLEALARVFLKTHMKAKAAADAEGASEGALTQDADSD
mmetsp:Transcript_70075/g.130990  ORF Transcript_70075/g.130990 Transcript_70075/m.130990 type:complete len:118 (+) Transcript_70075:1144-1497(+)